MLRFERSTMLVQTPTPKADQTIAFNPADGFDPNANGDVKVVVVQRDRKILIGGDFTTVSPNGGPAVTRNHLARLNPDGTLDTAFDPNPNGAVYAIALQDDCRILVGGQFNGINSIGGQTRNYIARLDSTTGAADSFNPNANQHVNSIVVQTDGRILVGGDFHLGTSIGGQTRNFIARLDATTGLADSFNPNPDGSDIYAMALQPDGKIMVVGGFSNIGGQARNWVARLDPTTGLADSFSADPNSSVYAVAVQPDGKVVIGGGFGGVNAQFRFRVARLEASGALDPTRWPDINQLVRTVALQPDGKIVIGGGFSNIGHGIARLNPDGTIDGTFNANADTSISSGDVMSVAVQADGKILLGGTFSQVNGRSRNHIARLQSDGSVDQTIASGTLANKTLGDPDFTVNATATSGLPASFASQTPAVCTVSGSTVHLVSTGTCTIRASQGGNSDYNAAPNVDQSFTVAPFVSQQCTMPKTTPIITWSNPSDIVYGTPLSSTQLNATASVPGTFTYTPAAGSVQNAGNNQTLSVSFIPNDTSQYNDAIASVSINVLKADPVITWSNPADIVYGTTLNSTQLNASASVPGTLTYTPNAGTQLSAGNGQNLSVSLTPNDAANYNNASANVHINVLKATPTINWSNPADIIYGTALGNTQLNATASVPGTLTYTPNTGTVLNAGAGQTLSVSLTPTDTSNYNSASKTVSLNVLKATPTITWNDPADIVYGPALGGTQLNATANLPGSFAYTPTAGTLLNAGNGQALSVNFTPNDAANYNNASATVHINVLKATPTITWNDPADIVYGTALSSTQLNATSNVQGSSAYSPAASIVLNAGNAQILSVNFTPNDNANYNSASATVHINVLKATPTINWSNPSDLVYGGPLSAGQLNGRLLWREVLLTLQQPEQFLTPATTKR